MSFPKPIAVLLVFVSLTMLVTTMAIAQPSFGGRPSFGGGPPGGGPPGGGPPDGGPPDGGPPDGGSYGGRGGPPGRGGFDPSEFISRMDANGNGMLDPDEISDRARGFLVPRLQEAGIDTSKPIPMAKITESFQKMREDRDRERSQESEVVTKTSSGLVGDFSFDEEIPLVPDFSLPDDSPLLQSGPLEERYSREVMERTNRTLSEYDRNRDGTLDGDELRRGRWSPPANESDLNKDGRLTKVELAERYKQKFSGSSSTDRGGQDSRDSERTREDDRGRDSSRDSGRADGRSERSTSSSSASRSSSSSSGDSKNERIQKYALSMLEKYDTNKNKKLEEDEYKSMRGNPERADTNQDKQLSMDELTVFFGGTPGKSSGSTTSRSAPATKRIGGGARTPSLEERLSERGVNSKFITQDKNSDGNLQMAEFSSSWDEKKLDDFDELDSNGDGVISPSEWIENGGK